MRWINLTISPHLKPYIIIPGIKKAALSSLSVARSHGQPPPAACFLRLARRFSLLASRSWLPFFCFLPFLLPLLFPFLLPLLLPFCTLNHFVIRHLPGKAKWR
jgi:hypothetical protein